MDLEYEPELDHREYVCETCRLVHWLGAPDPCDRNL